MKLKGEKLLKVLFCFFNKTELWQGNSLPHYVKAKSLAKWSKELHIYTGNQNIQSTSADDMDYITSCLRE